MKKRKVGLKPIGKNIYNKGIVSVSKEEKEYFFEIGKELTSDVAEAVAILMRNVDSNEAIWDLEINDIVYENLSPGKSLFWLTGGYLEWRTLENYNKPWSELYLDFQEEFGYLILNIVKKSKTLNDIKENFLKYLNLPILYDFALSKNMIK
jgi:hypothetical protein